jgi:diguanylate cyclase (GGDEF)-like protein
MDDSMLGKLSLVPRGLRYKLMVAFSLMSIIPILVCVYLSGSYIMPRDVEAVTLLILISLIVAMFGLYLLYEIVKSVIKVSSHAKDVMNGEFSRLDLRREDEVGTIGETLNRLSDRIKENLKQLKCYEDKIREVDIEVKEKVILLSNLVQIGDMISRCDDIDKILKFILGKLSSIAHTQCAALMMDDGTGVLTLKSGWNITSEIRDLRITQDSPVFKEIIVGGKSVVVDDANRKDRNNVSFVESLHVKNAAIFPVGINGHIEGMLMLTNNVSGFTYNVETLDVITVMLKQIGIALENGLLMHKVEELKVRDELTNLFNEKYFVQRLGEEAKRAVLCQRPCSVIAVDIDDFGKYCRDYGQESGERVLKEIGQILDASVKEIDRVARLKDDDFAILLPEKDKKEAVNLAEEIRRKVEKHPVPAADSGSTRTLKISAGVSEEPIDGNSAEELLRMAMVAVKIAKVKGKNMVVGYSDA